MFRKIYLEITNCCNLACKFCPGTKREPHFMTEDEFRRLAGKLVGHTDFLYFHLMGEPLLHPKLAAFFNIAGELGFKVIITTNGTLLKAAGETLLAAKSLHKVNISLQSFEANESEKIGEYIAECTDFAQKCSEKCIICVFRLWNENGWDRLNGEIETALSKNFPQPWEKGRGGYKLGAKLWLEPGEKFDWPELSAEDGGESGFCYGLRDQIGVLCDGTVVPCCLDHEGDIPLGNLFGQSLDEILASERARAIYDGFSRRQAVEALCRRCGYARRFNK